MQVKTCPAFIKAAGAEDGADEGVFEAIVAAYNIDSVNDRIVPGAFKKSLDEWKASGDPIPVLWSHKSDDPDYHIGFVEDAEERPEGLWVKARIDMDEPKSRKIFKLMKGRRIRSFSFSYDIVSAKPGKKDDGGDVQDLHELHIHEIGPCLIPANRETNLLGVKNTPELDLAKVPPQPMTVTVELNEREKALIKAFRAADGEAAPGQVCGSCGEPGHLTCFEQKTTVSDVIEGIKASGGLSKEHVPVLETLLADLAAGMGSLADVLDVLVGPEADEKAKPAQPADVPAPEAKDVEPARPGTAS
ncbi:MAG: HK97 family phage prohead protease, partial [Actinomycetota bacterium]|nr:HK97 family phage prohead protease [Actinomycetota bacterium]